MGQFEKFWNMARRKWLYVVVLAFIPLAVGWDFVSDSQATQIALFVAAVLGVGGSSASLRNLKPDYEGKVPPRLSGGSYDAETMRMDNK